MKSRLKALLMFSVSLACIGAIIRIGDPDFLESLLALLFTSFSMISLLYWEVLGDAIKRYWSNKISK